MSLKKESLIYDVVIIGGGANGSGIAAEAAERGLKIALFEKNDFASASSSASSKLLHGGLRYLENFEFSFVKNALVERDILLKKLPFIAHPLAFQIPILNKIRFSFTLKLGLKTYDMLAVNSALPKYKKIKFNKLFLKPKIKKGFEYFDCWVDDSRLVILNILQAHLFDGNVQNYHEVIKCDYDIKESLWKILVKDKIHNKEFHVFSKFLINASGAWVNEVCEKVLNYKMTPNLRLIKGSHIIIRNKLDVKNAFLLQHFDKRFVFVIPYLENFLIVGTTDYEFDECIENVEISESEKHYLIDIFNTYFNYSINKEDILSSYSGIRPLIDDKGSKPQNISRKFLIKYDKAKKLVSVFGGKLTTYRLLSEQVIDKLKEDLTLIKPSISETTCFIDSDVSSSPKLLYREIHKKYPFLPKSFIQRLISTYGEKCEDILKGSKSLEDLGEDFGLNIFEKEITYTVKNEFVMKAEDFLYRRTKLGLLCNDNQIQKISHFVKRLVNVNQDFN
ncbi:glycerol-3-phosphate dehydrogenase [Paraphotobacterium marinum]|uniref:Glycerol-3-phosphate dehydrogenase n=2 Tax=Paraphotobacterium marinum TaxID=1755811 RepID=A0A220VEW7_9GAMM|nr:glycerol-3-phosphate dehydrogenase [Paraphotobacterium marinum]ASK78889.1 glycerol-3-phosphate dehydrogenase [Paraphotobacterium marinum]